MDGVVTTMSAGGQEFAAAFASLTPIPAVASPARIAKQLADDFAWMRIPDLTEDEVSVWAILLYSTNSLPKASPINPGGCTEPCPHLMIE
ncbi:hypothetical protein [Sneathiella chinensis]|uniref:Uncharacterized protein n=1 Tax=Sneathiella chinensis TaxID=349750 RepID=A0ABQ5U6K0_9PROT|nr:hypothetical protein [Sneathiella chinensis]GLQ07325.1 hypothetical protein GCM10007924_25460 [Sneathiella chinensis]